MAGRGSRLRPHTLTVPKPLIPIAGKPIVHRLVEDIAAILNQDLDNDVNQIKNLIENPLSYFQISKNGMQWSRQFTMDKFEIEIKKLL
mgnify:CR=1 FL=1